VIAVLEVEGVSKSYGQVRALDRCTFGAAPKRLTGLLGPNGAGKTTLMRCLLGLVEPEHGSMQWRGEPITERVWRRFGYMPEERGLYPSMVVREQVVHFARLSGLTLAAARPAAEAVIGRVGLADLAGQRVEQLSHGNQQRVQLAIALVHEPELLILDEPFAGLDPLGVATLGELLRSLAEDGAGVLFSSHQLDLVQHLCQDIVTVDHGRVVLAGSLEQLQAAAGRRHVTVVFAQAAAAGWCAGLADVVIEAADDRHVRLAVAADRDPGDILRAARSAGPLISFDFEPPSLDDMFREAVPR
jgi:ABC-2 type transport system ATP-binding protein